MTRFRAFTLTAVLAGLLAGGVAFAQGGGPGEAGPADSADRDPADRADLVGLPLQALNLTETQQDQIKQLTQQYRAAESERRRAASERPWTRSARRWKRSRSTKG